MVPAKEDGRALLQRALWLAPALLLACTTPLLPPAEPASETSEHLVRRVRDLYLYPEHLDRRMLVGALESLEMRFDPIRFEDHEDHGWLRVGDALALVPIDPEPDPARFRTVLGQVLQFVRQHMGEELDEEDETELEFLALRGALIALDHYSTIFSGRGTEDFRIRFSGKLHGIGSRIGRRDGELIAVRVFPDSPAEKAGLRDGDVIVAIEDEPTRPLSVGEAVERIRGEDGTVVTLRVQRGDEIHEIRITRGEVTVPSVEARELGDGVGYARIFQVSRTTPAEFREKVDGLGKLSGLVLDLRGNSGGSMLAAASLADGFLSSELIVRVVGRNGQSSHGVRDRAVAGPEVRYPFPVVVLVDAATASAAEILAGALAPLPRVTLIGETTFGKGLIQRVVKIPDENLLKLTVAEYRLSGNRAIHLEGIEPDLRLRAVDPSRVGPLANLAEDAIAYLGPEEGEDLFPVDFGKEIILHGRVTAAARMTERAREVIHARLAELGIAWRTPEELPEVLPDRLDVDLEPRRLAAGRPTTIQLLVRNPNPFPIRDAWASLGSPSEYLAEQVLFLGDLPANGATTRSVDLHVPEGISAAELPVAIHVASGMRPLQSQRRVLHIADPAPTLHIDVERVDTTGVRVTVHNRGPGAAGDLRVDVQGASRALERLDAGASETVELPLSGEADTVAVTLIGAQVRRRIEVPLPEGRITVEPPEMSVERTGFWRWRRLRVSADAAEGLQAGWIRLDGQKTVYTRWDGERRGSLQATLGNGEHRLQAKVVTLSGVAVIDSRMLTTE